MFRVAAGFLHKNQSSSVLKNFKKYATETNLPAQADVVIVGGGNIGCNTLYQLSKRGVKAVLLERTKVTSGTTWHSAGLFWSLRPNDVEINILASTRKVLTGLEKETDLDPGWINNGGLFLAHNEERLNEYKRLHTLGHLFGIESHILSPQEAAKLSPILNPKTFLSALYSPGDGVVDPSMFCSALIKGATNNGGQLFENCPLTNILIDPSSGVRKITGVETPHGVIRTGCIVNTAGVWSRNIAQMVGLDIPISPMKHAYVVTESVPDVKGTPNIRDHDFSVYYRIQGESICFGGYETNPEILKEVPEDFQFSLYDLNYSIFDTHLQKATETCPVFNAVGIKSTVCGPESFTPDHRPLLGEDPRLNGLYYGCGFNSAGIMLSAGCAEQLAIWITEGRPELSMFAFDIRRFTPSTRTDRAWITETSHESYAKNYSIVFPHDQPLSGRNHKISTFHEALIANGAVMQQAQGWERPGYFIKESTAPVRGYDWYGYYDHVRNEDRRYENQLEQEHTFEFPKHHNLIGEEALAARNNAALFDLSYFAKMYLTGPDAQEAADWLFTADTDREQEKVIYSCALNSKGGVEADVTVTPLHQGVGTLVGPILKGRGYYIVAGGASGYQTWSHLKTELARKKFRSVISDVTDKMGILSIQGPKSGEILQSVTETPITDERFPFGMSHLISINGHTCRAMRISFIGELGYELHIPVASCIPVYKKIAEIGASFNMRCAGYRALYSLSCEKGYHLWNYDLRSDDNPVEANLAAVCRNEGPYLGKQHVDKLKQVGAKKRRVFLTIPNRVPVWGLETIWRDDAIVGFLRRGEYAYYLDSSIGVGYAAHPKGHIVDDEYLKTGNYEVEVMGRRYPAILHLKSPFDPKSLRVLGQYDNVVQELTHFED